MNDKIIFTKNMARAVDKLCAYKLGLQAGHSTAASRRAAAASLGLPYEDFLAVWKGERE